MKFFAILGLVLGCNAWAQGLNEQALRAADATHSVTALPPYQPLPASGASALVQQPTGWRDANATVGQFPRGHQDLIRWERAHGLDAPPHRPQQVTPPGAIR
jgi:hypothetical protein